MEMLMSACIKCGFEVVAGSSPGLGPLRVSAFKLNNLKNIYNLYSHRLTQALSKMTSFTKLEGIPNNALLSYDTILFYLKY
jgi:hypothetical protein